MKYTAWDLESHLIKHGMTVPKMVCYSEKQPGQEPKLMLREEGLDRIEHVLKYEHSINQTLFDAAVACAEREHFIPLVFKAVEEGRLSCIRVREMMIRNATGELKFIWDEEAGEYKKQNFHLFNLVQRYKGYSIEHKKKKQEGGPDIWRLRYNELDGVPLSEWPEEAKKYAIDDSIETLDVFEAQERVELQGDEIPGFVSQMKAAWALYLTGTWGFRTDPVAVREYRAELEKDFAKQIEKCQEFGFRRKGSDPSRDMKKIVDAVEKWYADHDKEPELTKGGAISTSRDQLKGTDHPGLVAVAESVRLEKQLTTYIAALERGTEVPLTPNYNVMVETFRTSCSGGMKIDGVPVGMNCQNLPRGGSVRKCVVPRKGWVFAFCDLDTIEMRSLGQICLDTFGQSAMVEAVREGADTHCLLAAEILQQPYKDVYSAYKAGDKNIKNYRQTAKNANYGLMGGMGIDTFISYAKANTGVVIPRPIAEKAHSGFRKVWPEMPLYFNHCSWLTRDGNATVVFPRSEMIRGDVPYTAVCNSQFQHLAAMGAKASLYQVVYECYVDTGSPLYGCRPWLFCHDEIGIEIPIWAFGRRRTHLAAMRLRQIMIEKTAEWHPDVPIGASVCLAYRWYKGAEALYENGLLTPVKPEMHDNKEIWVPDHQVRVAA